MNRKQIRLRGEDIIKHLELLFVVILISLSIITCKKQLNQIFIKLIDPNPLFPISLERKYGYIDKNGKIVINPQFDYAKDFSKGPARIKIGGTKTLFDLVIGGKWGYIDKNGKIVWNPSE